MPVDYSRYPKNWKDISLAIRQRSGQRCECEGQDRANSRAPEPHARRLPRREPESDVSAVPLALRPRASPAQFPRNKTQSQGIKGYVRMTETSLGLTLTKESFNEL